MPIVKRQVHVYVVKRGKFEELDRRRESHCDGDDDATGKS